MEETKIYRVRVTNTGAEITYEGNLVYTVPDHGNFDRHLALALDYLKQVEKRQWLILKTAPQSGTRIMSAVLSKEYLVFTEPIARTGLREEPLDPMEAPRGLERETEERMREEPSPPHP